MAVIETCSNIPDLRKSNLMSDVILEIPGVKEFPAHKLILSAASEYFKLLFNSSFKESTATKVPINGISAHGLNLYLDLVYNQKIWIYGDWRQTIEIIEFAKYTQTHIKDRDKLLVSIGVSPQDFPEYIQSLYRIYEGDIPIDVIEKITIYDPARVDYKSFDESFIKLLITNQPTNSARYRIAQKAVQDGFDPSLYSLIDYEDLDPKIVTAESLPFLRSVNRTILTDTLFNNSYMIVVIENFLYFDHAKQLVYYRVSGRIRGKKLKIAFKFIEEGQEFDSPIYILSDGVKVNWDILKPGTIIKFLQHYDGGPDTIINKFEIVR